MGNDSISFLLGMGSCVLALTLIVGLVVSLQRKPTVASRVLMEKSRLRDRIATIPRHRIKGLRQLPYQTLASLPAVSLEKMITHNGRKIWVRQHRDLSEDGSLRIVVQAFDRRLFRVHTLTAEGFVVSPDGVQTDLPPHLLADFLDDEGRADREKG